MLSEYVRVYSVRLNACLSHLISAFRGNQETVASVIEPTAELIMQICRKLAK